MDASRLSLLWQSGESPVFAESTESFRPVCDSGDVAFDKMKEWRLWGVRAGREFGVKNGTILILRPPVVASGAFQTAACGVAFVHGLVASGRPRFTLFRRNCDSASVSTSFTQERQFRGRGGSLGVARHGYSTAFCRRVHEVVALGTARSSPAFPAALEARCLKAT